MKPYSIAILTTGALAGLSSCMPAGDGAGDEPQIEITEVAQGLIQTSTVTTRGVNPTANALDDWGSDKLIDPALVINHTLKLRYCAQHFPVGSPALANLTAAINTYSAVAGVAIDISDIAAAAGTTTHPDLATFALPSNAIYIDYSYTMDDDVFAATALPSTSCDSSSPQHCTTARIYINGNNVVSDTDIFNTDKAPSVGVFMHELGHVFGMKHITDDDDTEAMNNTSNMWFDRTTIHGNKLASTDFRSTVIQAATLAFLRAYYPDPNAGALATDEIVAHRNMSIGDAVASPTRHIEFNPSKSYMDWGSGADLIADKNEVKLRWNPTADNGSAVPGAFEPCTAAGTLPRWFARMSDLSTSTVNTPFDAVFQTSSTETGGTWTTVAQRAFDSYVAGQADFRQIDWEKTFPISAADVNLPGGAGLASKAVRRLRFKADSGNALSERAEGNNEWWVNLCLYPASNTTCQNTSVVCDEP